MRALENRVRFDAPLRRFSGDAKCSARATRFLRSGDRFWTATSLYLISGVSDATCRRRRGVATTLAHDRDTMGKPKTAIVYGKPFETITLRFKNDPDGAAAMALRRFVRDLVKQHDLANALQVFKIADMRLSGASS